jgi:hypothetical protein
LSFGKEKEALYDVVEQDEEEEEEQDLEKKLNFSF